MGTITVADKSIEVDETGFLINRADWSEEVAAAMAKADGFELTPDRWEVIKLAREFYDQHQPVPAAWDLVRVIRERLGEEEDKLRAAYVKYGLDKCNLRSPWRWWSARSSIRAMFGPDRWCTEYLDTLFPLGLYKQARRYAGLPSPKVNNRVIHTDEEGFLSDDREWNENVGQALARAENCELTPEQWEVIRFLRYYYGQFQMFPPVRVLPKAIGKMLGPERGNKGYLYKLFPAGLRQMMRWAGFPKPHAQP